VSRAALTRSPAPIPLARAGAPETGREGVALYWLGQAGFLVESASLRILIDPYLSDSLGIKYRGTALPHIRMSPPPVAPEALRDIDIVLASHGHGDHMDPLTIAPVAAANPDCRFVVPASCAERALSRGVPLHRLARAQAFASIDLGGAVIHPIPSAHEALAIDDHGSLIALGFVIELGGVTIYHPGDCAPYPGLVENLSPFEVDLALLPVNGRDPERAAAGILGNFSLEEAVSLAENAGFGSAIGHHFGMFDFNTIDEAESRRFLGGRAAAPPFVLAEAGLRYEVMP
jgi:L-ascorbate metabolism protein UlaG (beta-lactamase superfamily)